MTDERPGIHVHDNGFVHLDASEATDLSVVNSARVSYGKRRHWMDERDVGLINHLMKHRHGTPFEHNFFRFHVKCPIFVAREWQRHRWSSFNEFSQRYAEVPPDFYLPESGKIREQVGKPGAYEYRATELSSAENVVTYVEEAYSSARMRYEELLRLGVARELARIVLPMGVYTEFYWSVNARSLMNFLMLRSSDQAQEEIRDYAAAAEVLFEHEMPFTHEAFDKCGRIAP